jgi:hypothetical protein
VPDQPDQPNRVSPAEVQSAQEDQQAKYRLLLLITDTTHLQAWLDFATRLCPPSGEILLRGMIVIPEDKSLSEGATLARQLRDAIDQVARDLENVDDTGEVYVDYRPMERVIDDVTTQSVDLLLVQWRGPDAPTGGLMLDTILQHTPCDLVLVSGETWAEDGPVLLSLRGGTNMTLGVNVAHALAGEDDVTLFHAAENKSVIPDLNRVMRNNPMITRTVSMIGNLADGIAREARYHKAVVLGAMSRQPDRIAKANPVLRTICERTQIPMILVRARSPGDIAFPVLPLRRNEESLSTRVDRWFAENTFHSSEFTDLQKLLAQKERQGVTISLGLPALNEEVTVGKVITTIKQALMDDVPLLDEIVLIDSNSTDRTVEIAESLGLTCYRHPEILPEVGSYRGKGEALWKSLHVLRGDIIAWIDTDITNIHPRFIYGLVGPLLRRPNIQYVKGFYHRPIKVGDQLQAYGGGRVTELVARPLLNLFYPELSGIIQPLSGEYAGRREVLQSVPFFSGYGVETGLLIDIHERYGLEAIAQTDLEERVHHNQPLIGLSKMSFAIHQVFINRLERRYGIQLLDKANTSMKLVQYTPERFALDVEEIGDVERPPIMSIAGYHAASLARHK